MGGRNDLETRYVEMEIVEHRLFEVVGFVRDAPSAMSFRRDCHCRKPGVDSVLVAVDGGVGH